MWYECDIYIYIYKTVGVRKWGYYFGRSLDGLFLSFGKAQSKKKNMDLGLPPWIGNLQIWCIWDPWYGKTPFWIAIPPSSSMFDAFDHHPGEFHRCWMTGWWWLEPWNFSWLSIQLGIAIMSSSQLTKSMIFQVGQPPTRLRPLFVFLVNSTMFGEIMLNHVLFQCLMMFHGLVWKIMLNVWWCFMLNHVKSCWIGQTDQHFSAPRHTQ